MKKLVLTAMTALALSASSAFADNNDAPVPVLSAPAKSGAVIGVTAGYAVINTPLASVFWQLYEDALGVSGLYTTSRKGNVTAGIYSGYLFALGRHFLLGPIFSYNWFGNSQYTTTIAEGAFGSSRTTIQSQAISLLAKGELILNNGLNFSVKAGAAYIIQNDIVHNTGIFEGISDSRTTHGVRPQLGVGMGYAFDNGIGIGANFDYIFGYTGDSTTNSTYGIKATTLDLSYTFQ